MKGDYWDRAKRARSIEFVKRIRKGYIIAFSRGEIKRKDAETKLSATGLDGETVRELLDAAEKHLTSVYKP